MILNDIFDFDILNGTLYYITTTQKNVLRVASLNVSGEFIESSSITFDGIELEGVVCSDEFVTKHMNSDVNVFVRINGVLHLITDKIPYLSIDGTSVRVDISKIIYSNTDD